MRVALFLTNFPNLSETFLLNQITGLMDLGVDTDIFASASPSQSQVHPQVEKYNLANKAYYSDTVAPVSERLMKGVSILGRNFYKNPLAYTEAIKSLSLRDIFYIYNFITNRSKNSYDLIHAHYGSNGLIAAILKEASVFKGKLLTSFHGYDMSLLIAKKGKDVYKKLFEHGDLFLPVSDFWKEKLIDMGCDRDRIIVHRMGIDLDQYRFKERKWDTGGLKLITVARLDEKKGCEYSIKAVKKLIRANPGLEIEYMIIGEGPLRTSLQNLIQDAGMKDKIKILGAMNQEEVRAYLEIAHIFILSSSTSIDGDMEGIPVVLMEAQACGIPVVSTLHSGIPEVVLDGKSGFLVPERDVDALSSKLEYLIQHPELWPEMGRCGRKFVEEKYDIKMLNSKLVRIYDALLTDNTALLDELRGLQ
jgi:colanic acid/amylovoran biosynthesis glycosyltransferase